MRQHSTTGQSGCAFESLYKLHPMFIGYERPLARIYLQPLRQDDIELTLYRFIPDVFDGRFFVCVLKNFGCFKNQIELGRKYMKKNCGVFV